MDDSDPGRNLPVDNPLMLINGELVESESGRRFATINPANEEELGTVPEGSAKDVERVYDSAASPSASRWPSRPIWRFARRSTNGGQFSSATRKSDKTGSYIGLNLWNWVESLGYGVTIPKCFGFFAPSIG